MKNIIKTFLPVLIAVSIYGCSDMNDKHDIYLAQGEKVYIGKVDSINTFPGNNRIKIKFWASDPRCKSVGFFWSPYNDSIFIDIEKTSSNDVFEIIIGGEESKKQIKEGSYTLKIKTYDNKGNSSIFFEKNIRIYGEIYQNTLSNRVLFSKEYVAGTESLTLNFGLPLSVEDVGINVFYTDIYGDNKVMELDNEQLNSTVLIPEISITEDVFYQTLYKPHPQAIDLFKATPRKIEIK